MLAELSVTRRSAIYAIEGLISKIGDIKLKTQVKETLKAFSENISLNYVSLKVRIPKICLHEFFSWLMGWFFVWRNKFGSFSANMDE